VNRQRKMIELVYRELTKASEDAETIRKRGTVDDGLNKARIRLACAIDDALADLAHATAIVPCNHGACLGTTLDNGEWAHDDDRERASVMEYNPGERWRGYCETISPEMLKLEIKRVLALAANDDGDGMIWRYGVARDVAAERGVK